jgi:hypothetical protein
MKIRVIQTNDKRQWTEHIARNIGAAAAVGEYLFMIDVDYIIPKETIAKAMSFQGDRMPIRRRFGVLDANGDIQCDPETLGRYHVKRRWIRKVWIPGHRSQFLMRRSLFWRLGGYNGGLDGVKKRTGGAGEKFWRAWQKAEGREKVRMNEDKLEVFMYPEARWCTEKPENMFHELEYGECERFVSCNSGEK